MPTTMLVNGLLFLIAIAGQVIGASLLPATRGFTSLGATVTCLVAFAVALFGMARLIASGINLTIVVPVMTCTVPLAILAIAVSYYGEPASLMKIGLLLLATLMIGIASSFP